MQLTISLYELRLAQALTGQKRPRSLLLEWLQEGSRSYVERRFGKAGLPETIQRRLAGLDQESLKDEAPPEPEPVNDEVYAAHIALADAIEKMIKATVK